MTGGVANPNKKAAVDKKATGRTGVGNTPATVSPAKKKKQAK